ncbi:metal-dependent hydrolase [Salinadaptatus halalkaliphilus]|uniref:Metal-dependent hydrolase n=2 Tax=Salinadaptatus halalkaliphilus TaxID=2419781 RepID=A0A4S3TPR6_9EURY|nr:metal-dependent hydrolase [Salinadaptatus halalkaliphilus]
MMATTHVFVGLLLAGGVAMLAPDYAGVAAAGAILGGLVPDFDVVGAHRKTLHFPVYYWLPAIGATVLAFMVPTPTTVFLAVCLLAAAVHCLTDVIGGSHELRPWEGNRDRAVYSHYHGRWLEPRRWIAYDGSPGDLAFAAVLAVPLLFVFETAVQFVVIGMLLVSISYALLRKPLASGAGWLLDRN